MTIILWSIIDQMQPFSWMQGRYGLVNCFLQKSGILVPESCFLRSQGTAFTAIEEVKLRLLQNGSIKYFAVWLICFSFDTIQTG